MRVAGGEPLWFTQADVTQRGHAIECRIYAEDPSRGLLPQSGTLLRYAEPQGPGLRVDSGVAEGQTIGVDYDPMLAKLVAYAETREAALARLREALRGFRILGIRHNIPFLLKLLALPDVTATSPTYAAHTGLIESRLDALVAAPGDEASGAAQAVAQWARAHAAGARSAPTAGATAPPDPWETVAW